MNKSQKESTTVEDKSTATLKDDNSKNKSCFIIMPIADMDDYEPGHFLRVYEHLIKPACINAGFEPHRADFVAASNYIIIDILRKILDSDLVICDLSGRNPNVLYELGVRQAFNLPTVLIKDIKTPKIFDIQGLRYTEYNHTLRIDEVEKERERIQKSILATAANPNDVNSMIQLLGVKPAPLPHKVELSNETSVILESLKDISIRISKIELSRDSRTINQTSRENPNPITRSNGGHYFFNNENFRVGETLFLNGTPIGELIGASSKEIKIKAPNNKILLIDVSSPEFEHLTGIPF